MGSCGTKAGGGGAGTATDGNGHLRTAKRNRWDARQLPSPVVPFYYGAKHVEAVCLVEAVPCTRRVTISGWGFGVNPVVLSDSPRNIINGCYYPLEEDHLVMYLEPGEELYAQNQGAAAVEIRYRVEEVFEHADCR